MEQQAQALLDEIIDWVTSFNGDVPHSSFLGECDVILTLVSKTHALDTSYRGQGLLTLEYACLILGIPVPQELWDYPQLPGHRGPASGSCVPAPVSQARPRRRLLDVFKRKAH